MLSLPAVPVQSLLNASMAFDQYWLRVFTPSANSMNSMLRRTMSSSAARSLLTQVGVGFVDPGDRVVGEVAEEAGERVVAGAAVGDVDAGAGSEPVVAVAGQQAVVAGIAVEPVVTCATQEAVSPYRVSSPRPPSTVSLPASPSRSSLPTPPSSASLPRLRPRVNRRPPGR
jgi:hypothetical protein